MLKYHLFDASWSISVHVDTFPRSAHLDDFVLVHSSLDELLTWHVDNELLCFHDIEHLSNLVLCERVDEVYLVKVDQDSVLSSSCIRTGHLSFMHLH